MACKSYAILVCKDSECNAMGGLQTPNPHKERQSYVRKTPRVPTIQSAELQRVLQPQALRIRQKRQGLPEEEKAETKTEKRRLPRINGAQAYEKRPFLTLTRQLTIT